MEELNNNTGAVPAETQQQTTAVPENTAPAQAPVQAQAQTPGCTGNCKNCNSYQRNYCAAQIGYNIQNALAGFMARLAEMQGLVAHMSEEVTALRKQSEEPSAIIEAPTPDEQPKKNKKPSASTAK